MPDHSRGATTTDPRNSRAQPALDRHPRWRARPGPRQSAGVSVSQACDALATTGTVGLPIGVLPVLLVKQDKGPYTPSCRGALEPGLGDLVSSGAVVPPGPTRRRLRVGPILWALIPALSLGLLAPVPFAHAAVRLKQRRLWAVTAAYAIGSVGWLVGAATPAGGWGDALFGTAAFALMV